MTGSIIDGGAASERVRAGVAEGVRDLVAGGGPTPGLATVLVGADPASQVYVRNKHAATEKAAMRGFHEQRAVGLVSPAKDVDGFHPWNVGQLVLGRPGLRSCTPAGVMVLLRELGT